MRGGRHCRAKCVCVLGRAAAFDHWEGGKVRNGRIRSARQRRDLAGGGTAARGGRLVFIVMALVAALLGTVGASPAGAEPPGPEASLAVGDDHSCVLVEEGRIACVGDGDSGQLGDSTNFEDRRKPHLVAGIETAIGVSAGEDHTCAVLSDGSVKCWGDNDKGQLGNGGGPDRSSPVDVRDIDDAVAIAAGDNHSCAVRENGTVLCWGDNAEGQLGNGTRTNSAVPVFVPNIGRAQAVAAGQFHTCVVTSDDFVSCWGDNRWGQLGDGTSTDRLQARRVVQLSEVSSVAAGFSHTCATEKTGAVKCWGSNEFGQLGDGTSRSTIRPSVVPGLTNARQVSVGYRTSCAVAGGVGYCWGNNEAGQLGDGSLVDRRLPSPVVGAFPIAAVGVGDDHACFMTDTRLVACWGDNSDGQLGRGDYVAQITPVVLDAEAYIAVEQIPPPSNIDELVNRPDFIVAHAQVLRLYQAFFARNPDLEGAIFWIEQYNNGDSLLRISERFTGTAEFRFFYDGTSNAEFVNRVYQNVLGRGPEQVGFDFWTGQLAAGMTRGNMVRLIATSAPEFVEANRFGGL